MGISLRAPYRLALILQGLAALLYPAQAAETESTTEMRAAKPEPSREVLRIGPHGTVSGTPSELRLYTDDFIKNLTAPYASFRVDANGKLTIDSPGGVSVSGLSSGVTDHGALTGLGDDDHPQYYNQSRGDARYLQLSGAAPMTGPLTINPGSVMPPIMVGTNGQGQLVAGLNADTADGYHFNQDLRSSATPQFAGFKVAGTTVVPYDVDANTMLLATGFGTPISSKVYLGDGTGWQYIFSNRYHGTDKAAVTIDDRGNIWTATVSRLIAPWDQGGNVIAAASISAGANIYTRASLNTANGVWTLSNGSFVTNGSAATPYFGIYNSSTGLTYGMATQVPGPSNTAVLGGYYKGLAISGQTGSSTDPIFGVLNKDQSLSGIGKTALTVLANNTIYTYNSILDNGSGNVGLRTSSISNWANGYGAIQLAGMPSIMYHTTSYGLYLNDNLYYDGTWKYRANGYGASFIAYSGGFYFRTASSGNKDAASDLTDRVYIANDGKMQIGGTTPQSALHVLGTAQATTGFSTGGDATHAGTVRIDGSGNATLASATTVNLKMTAGTPISANYLMVSSDGLGNAIWADPYTGGPNYDGRYLRAEADTLATVLARGATTTVQPAFSYNSGSPFTVSNSTVVTNLNADKADGYDFNQDVRSTGTPTFAALTVDQLKLDGNTISNINGALNSSSKIILYPDLHATGYATVQIGTGAWARNGYLEIYGNSSGKYTSYGNDGGHTYLTAYGGNLYLATGDSNGNLYLTPNGSGTVNIGGTYGLLNLNAASGQPAILNATADAGGDNDDKTRLVTYIDGSWTQETYQSGAWVANLTVNKTGTLTALAGLNASTGAIQTAGTVRIDNAGVGTLAEVSVNGAKYSSAKLTVNSAQNGNPFSLVRDASNHNNSLLYVTGSTTDWYAGEGGDSTSNYYLYNYGTSSFALMVDKGTNALTASGQLSLTQALADASAKANAKLLLYDHATNWVGQGVDGLGQWWVRGPGGSVTFDQTGLLTSPMIKVSSASPASVYAGQIEVCGSETSGAADTGGALYFSGHDGSTNRGWAYMRGMKANATPGDVNSYLSFAVRNASAGLIERLRIDQNGQLKLTRTLYDSSAVGNATLLFYDFGSGNWSGLGTDGSGNTWLRTSSGGTSHLTQFYATGGMANDVSAWSAGFRTNDTEGNGYYSALSPAGGLQLSRGEGYIENFATSSFINLRCNTSGSQLRVMRLCAGGPVYIENGTLNVGGVAATGPTPTAQAGPSTGSIADGTYYYAVTVVDILGLETKIGAQASYTVATGGVGNGQVLLIWTPTAGAVYYKIYRTTVSGSYGASSYLGYSYTMGYTDSAAATGAGQPPASYAPAVLTPINVIGTTGASSFRSQLLVGPGNGAPSSSNVFAVRNGANDASLAVSEVMGTDGKVRYRVGIGQYGASPDASLTVHQPGGVFGASDPFFRFKYGGAGAIFDMYMDGSTNTHLLAVGSRALYLDTNAATRAIVDGTGLRVVRLDTEESFGYYTASKFSILHASTAITGIGYHGTALGNNLALNASYVPATAASDATGGCLSAISFTPDNNNSNNVLGMNFWTADGTGTPGTAAGVRMTILPTGNVGINNKRPQTQLHVSGASPQFRIESAASPGYYTTIDHNGIFDNYGAAGMSFKFSGTQKFLMGSDGTLTAVALKLTGGTPGTGYLLAGTDGLGNCAWTNAPSVSYINLAYVKFTPQASAPASPTVGMMYVATDNHLYYYNGVTWVLLDH